jgi:membrane-associated phospholipid phosphatase
VALRATVDLDLAVTRALQSSASRPLDIMANANTLIGQVTVTAALAALLAIVSWRREPGVSWLVIGAFGIAVVVEVVLKLALTHPAPPAAYSRTLWDPLGVHITTPSAFPSGHIARVTALAFVAAALIRRRLATAAAAALVLYTFWARIYIGDHWLSDAAGGLALGVTAGCLAVMWLSWCRARDVRGS